MAYSRVQTSAVSAFQGNSTTVVGGTSLGYQRTLSVTAGSLLIARIFVRNSGAAGDLISAVTDNKGQTWTKRSSRRDTADDGLGWVYVYDCENAGAGSTTISLDFAIEDNNNFCVWDVTEFSGGSASGNFDKADVGNVDNATTPVTVANQTPAQAASLAVAVFGAKWSWFVNTGNAPPTGFTQDGLYTDNSYAFFQSSHKVLSTTDPVGASYEWATGQSTTDGAIAAVVIYKAATGGTNLRVRALFETTINSDSDITAYVWTGEPSSTTAIKVTGLTAEASGGVLPIPVTAAAGFSNGQTVNVLAFNSTDTSGLITATVETY